MVDAALGHLEELPRTQGEEVLVNQDLHGHNVLAATPQPWLVIDPKPLRGEREFGLAPIIRSFEFGHSERAVRWRLDRLSSELGLNRARVLGWTVAQTMAWSFDSGYRERHHENDAMALELALRNDRSARGPCGPASPVDRMTRFLMTGVEPRRRYPERHPDRTPR